MAVSFAEKHGLLEENFVSQFESIKNTIEHRKISLVRIGWSDSHGHSRVKLIPAGIFLEALTNGYNTNVATFTLDGSGGRVFRSFIRGGGMELEEMTGSPNLILIPDPNSFRALPWAEGVAWVMCDEYFIDGTPFHFSSRQKLKDQIQKLAKHDAELTVGLEIEWYLRKLDQPYLEENTGAPGVRGQAIQTLPIEPGYSYHSETNLDLIQPLLSELSAAYANLNIPVRSIENEYGPGQLECTFSPTSALVAADNYVLFRTATRQMCRRFGYFATFMCKPHIEGYYTSGWHLHQSMTHINSGKNLFAPEDSSEPFSLMGQRHLAGLLRHAAEATVFSTPTINGYQRFKPNSLAPDRATWSLDNRGAMLRVVGGAQDPGTRVENRIGEPGANPYLFIASQIACGLAGINGKYVPWEPDEEPYKADRPKLPKSLGHALQALGNSQLFRDQFGSIFINYYLALKQTELDRYKNYVKAHSAQDAGNGVSCWERDEYFDFF